MRLIIINGPTGIGKSTVAQKLHETIPLSFLLDIDAQRRYISGYREHRQESKILVFSISEAIVDTYLNSGHDVIIDKYLVDADMVNKFLELGKKHKARVYEFILNASKGLVTDRAQERGYRENGLLTSDKVDRFWNETQVYIKMRPEAVVVDVEKLDRDQVFLFIKARILG